jgi:hypothetical protein
MKKLMKKFIPDWLLRWYRNRNSSKFRNMSTNEVFTGIYKSNHWKSSESISGTGSEIKQTESLINDLDKLLTDMNIVSVLDLPCGDFKWMQKVDLSKIDYVGADIVEELIKNNIKQYKERENLKFIVLNLITDPLPKSDMIIVRDCLVHLSYEDINSAIKNIKSSGSKYLLTTTFTNYHLNHDIVTGDWRPLNLQEKPFNFSSPILVINENCTEGNGEYKDKSMAMWDISKV